MSHAERRWAGPVWRRHEDLDFAGDCDERLAAMKGATSLPLPGGMHRKAAVRVIDPRGNEVVTTVPPEA